MLFGLLLAQKYSVGTCWHTLHSFSLGRWHDKPVLQSANLCQPDSACHVINGLAY